MNSPLFITGTGTGIGKTIISAILVEALQADYWKPIQAGFSESTDALLVKDLISNTNSVIHPEVYKLKLAASPHIAAREEEISIDLDAICHQLSAMNHQPLANNYPPPTTNYQLPSAHRQLIIEGAGGIMVPLNENEFVIDLIEKLQVRVILVSRNYLGSINHSLLTATICKQRNIPVLGWIFNDQYLQYEEEIVQWSGYPKILSIPHTENADKDFISNQAKRMKEVLHTFADYSNAFQ